MHLYRRLSFKQKREKEKITGRPACPGPRPASGRVARVGCRPRAHCLSGPDRGQAGRFGHMPGPPGCPGRPKAGCQAGLPVSVRCTGSFAGCFPGQDGVQAGPRSGCLLCFFLLFLLQRPHFVAPYKRGLLSQCFSELFFSLSSIVAHFESSIPPHPSDDSCPNLGKQERRSRSTTPPNKISSK